MIFGLHVHVGMRDGDHAIAMMNGMLQFLPHVLALSASSPFWQGVDTGLASSRITVFEALPTAGHPCTFENWSDFESFYDSAVASSAITSIKDLWWDIRPHPEYGTVEVRACDALPTLSEAMSVIALITLLLVWLDAGYRDGQIPRPLPSWILRENKWRASRWGLNAEVVRDRCGRTSLLRRELEELLPRLEPLASTPGARDGLRGVERMLGRRGSHERQRRVFEEQKSLKAVADSLVEELRTDRPADGLSAAISSWPNAVSTPTLRRQPAGRHRLLTGRLFGIDTWVPRPGQSPVPGPVPLQLNHFELSKLAVRSLASRLPGWDYLTSPSSGRRSIR